MLLGIGAQDVGVGLNHAVEPLDEPRAFASAGARAERGVGRDEEERGIGGASGPVRRAARERCVARPASRRPSARWRRTSRADEPRHRQPDQAAPARRSIVSVVMQRGSRSCASATRRVSRASSDHGGRAARRTATRIVRDRFHRSLHQLSLSDRLLTSALSSAVPSYTEISENTERPASSRAPVQNAAAISAKSANCGCWLLYCRTSIVPADTRSISLMASSRRLFALAA